MQPAADARQEGVREATARAHSLAAFYATGGLLNLISSVIPGWHPASRTGLVVIAVVALITALGLYLARSRAGNAQCHVLLVVGSGLIGGCMISAGASPMALAYAFFFSWVSVYAASWWSVRLLAAHLGFAAACEAGAVAVIGLDGLIVPSCLVAMGACTAAGLVVHRLKAQVRELAMLDPLTGALNRRGLMQVLDAIRGRARWTVVALDLDGFKAFNDRHGHAEGDQVLRECVAGWTELLGAGEACARLGGDEFVLVCRRPVEAVAELVLRARGCVPRPLTLSAGVATAVPDEPRAAVFARADAALYRDKGVVPPGAEPAVGPGARAAHASPLQVRAN